MIVLAYDPDVMSFVCGRGHSQFKCPYECLGRVQWLLPIQLRALLADDDPLPTEDEDA